MCPVAWPPLGEGSLLGPWPRVEKVQACFWVLLLWGLRACSVRHEQGEPPATAPPAKASSEGPLDLEGPERGAGQGEGDEEMEEVL